MNLQINQHRAPRLIKFPTLNIGLLKHADGVDLVTLTPDGIILYYLATITEGVIHLHGGLPITLTSSPSDLSDSDVICD